ncbi:MAG: hypothetical protein QGD90_02095 [Candidatus Hydrogenedentes bacterium]|nr:hypothetical protein [Candidatus Hydrogenedentota bacterium]MDK1020412.1 hypothetical protein [Candidatus Hydrogenedentota bacterium]
MPVTSEDKKAYNALFVDFLYLLREYDVPASLKDLLELNTGIEKGLVDTIDDLFIFMRLTFVRRVEHMDAFERAFALYFYDIDIPPVAEGDLALLRTKAFRDWLNRAIEKGELPARAKWDMTPEELMRKFWERLKEQTEEHHGGNKWIGTHGNSPFGHSGNAEGGIRVGGGAGGGTALKVIGDRRYISYSDKTVLRSDNLRQALDAMKHLKHVGADSDLNLPETIRRTSKNGGEIDLVFERELRDKMKLVLLIDNGGYSMTPYIDLTRLLFSKIHERFDEIDTYYFHNCIYDRIWIDQRRIRSYDTAKLLQRRADTRIVILGDATMAPEELMSPFGSITGFDLNDSHPAIYWLNKIDKHFKYSCWLNPIPRERWGGDYGAFTLKRIRELFHMEDLTLGGVKGMVEFLSDKTGHE